MNKIYKIIWSKTRNCYVVVSELAKRNSKGGVSSPVKTARGLAALLLCACLAVGYGVPAAYADGTTTQEEPNTPITTPATTVEAGVAGSNVTHTGANASAWGNGTAASGSNATAWGNNTVASGMNATAWGIDSKAIGDNSMAFGDSSTANGINSLAALGGITAATAANSVAIGDEARAELANSIALGNGSVANRLAGVRGYRPDGTVAAGVAWVATANAISVGASVTDSDTA
ncbi:MAG: hypothetical protein IJ625_01355, partial [Acidaminococcaceae bacterium]|nr:hypothetical protein [Acidaminococcaceae bacterium]